MACGTHTSSGDLRNYALLEFLRAMPWKYARRKWAISGPKSLFYIRGRDAKAMAKRNLPTGIWPRRQRSGKVYYYYSSDRVERELPLGSDLPVALERYHALERLRLAESSAGGLPVLELLKQFDRCEPRPTGRHAANRRVHELRLLHEFFVEANNPLVANIGPQSAYETWLTRRPEATGFDSIRLLRLAWQFAQRNGYVDTICPWTPTSQQRERVAMEMADVLIPYAPAQLRILLYEILAPQAAMPAQQPHQTIEPTILPDDFGTLEFDLDIAKLATLPALRDSHREDLARALQVLTLQDLIDLLQSSTRRMHLPPGRIDLTARRRKLISSLR